MRRHLLLVAATAVLAGWVAQPFAAGQERNGLRITDVATGGYPDVAVTATVAAGLDAPDRSGDLQLLEDGEPRDAAVQQASSDELEVVLLIDTTGSMGGGPLAAAQQAAATFVEQLPADTDLAIVGYDVATTVVTGFDADRDEHLAGIDGLQAEGRTAMYDAIDEVIGEVFSPADETLRQALIVLTDGEDNASQMSLEEVADRLAASAVTLQGIEYLTAFTDEDGIRTLAEASGGQTFEASEPDALAQIYADLAADLANTYTLRYEAEGSGATDITVELTDEDGTRSDTRTVELPVVEAEPPPAVEEEPQATDDAVVAPVVEPRGRTWLIVGAAAWFAALALLLLALLVPREARAQLTGTAARMQRDHGSHEVAERVTLVTENVLRRRGYERGLNAALERAGMEVRPAEFVVVVGSITLVAGALGLLAGGALLGLTFAAATVLVARMVVTMRGNRRQAQFAEQLADTLQLLSGSLRAGYSLMQAIDAVAREADAPTCEEFGRVVIETRLGRDTTEAFTALADRMRTEDFRWVVQAIEIHREVGGDLAEVLDTVGDTIRDRDQIRRQVKALSAEGRLSGRILLALPFVVGALIWMTNRPYLAELTDGGLLGHGLIGLGLVLMTTGALWIKNLVKLEF